MKEDRKGAAGTLPGWKEFDTGAVEVIWSLVEKAADLLADMYRYMFLMYRYISCIKPCPSRWVSILPATWRPDLSCTGTSSWCTDTSWKIGQAVEISQKFAKYRYIDFMYRYIAYGEIHVSVHQGQVPILREAQGDQSASHSCIGTSYMMYRYISVSDLNF